MPPAGAAIFVRAGCQILSVWPFINNRGVTAQMVWRAYRQYRDG
jgi:hypothetical protein